MPIEMIPRYKNPSERQQRPIITQMMNNTSSMLYMPTLCRNNTCSVSFHRYLWAIGKNLWKRWKRRFFVLVQVCAFLFHLAVTLMMTLSDSVHFRRIRAASVKKVLQWSLCFFICVFIVCCCVVVCNMSES